MANAAGSDADVSASSTAPSKLQRKFLLDGDTVVLGARADDGRGLRVGFGQCVGTVLPSLTSSSLLKT